MTTHVLLRRLHYWAALAIALPASVLLGSGLLLQAKKHWGWVQPVEQRGSVSRPVVTLEELLASVRGNPGTAVQSWADVNRIDLRPGRGVAKVWLNSGWEVQVDLGTGQVLQTAYRRSDLIESIHDGSFFGGDWTKLGVFLPTGVILTFMWASGLWLFVVPIRARRRRRRRIAALGAGPLVLLAVAGCTTGSAATPQPSVFRTILRQPGDDDAAAYRIPGLATTTRGTVLAVFDVRHRDAGDLPGDIDVGLMRSTDHGTTWSSMQRILDFDRDEPGASGNGVGDPAILVDRRTGDVLVVALWSHGDRAWNGSGPGSTPEETGQLVATRSRDDGLTWSAPANLTGTIRGRDPSWRLLFNGPGNGIQLRDGTLVFAAQFRDAAGTPHSTFLWSSDGGSTWAVAPPAIPEGPATSEAQVAELADGSLLLSMRDESRSGRRAWARYAWNDDRTGGTWSEPWFAVPDPTCMASLIAHPNGTLLFSNPNSTTERVALTVRTSADAGRTWTAGRLLDPRRCAYSSLTVLPNGDVGVLYECGDRNPYQSLTFARFPLAWLNRQE